MLVDRGCIFVGHGLSNDFRIISKTSYSLCHTQYLSPIDIFVPPEQVLDTVDLYFLKSRQRRLSLRFLAWFVLDENIQTDTHDSIEDALSALKLYKAYIRYESEGVFDEKLDELYIQGRQHVRTVLAGECYYLTMIAIELETSRCRCNDFLILHFSQRESKALICAYA